jgi:predicted membrane-bound spermidine synthase
MLDLAFFLSGASALLFETLWFRLAGLSLGNSVWASSLVLASFMAGLALGNALAMRRGSTARHPIRVYALLELAVGACGLLLVLAFPGLTSLLVPLFRPLVELPWLLNALRLGIAFALMVIPAAAMGATLPLLVKALCAREGAFGESLGRLYGWNTLGAVGGALGGELLLIPSLGLVGTGVAAALLNALAALLAVALSRRSEPAAPRLGVEVEGAPRLALRHPSLLVAALLCGANLLALEVVWFRFLQLFVLGTSLAFAIMLAVVLLGIAGGGFLASGWLRRDTAAHRHLPYLALATAGLTALTYIGFEPASGVPSAATTIVKDAVRLMLPVSLLSGCLFTLLGRALEAEMGEETRTAGALTLANTLGGVAGALGGGLLILPRLGVEGAVFAAAVVYAAVAACSLPAAGAAALGPWGRRALAGGFVALLAYLALFPFGLMRNHFIRQTAQVFTSDGSELVAAREGLNETVLYFRREAWGQPLYHQLVTNNYSMSANYVPARRYMKHYVYWPLAVKPETRSALLISYGVGSTAKALADTARLETIDVVDISREILELSSLVFPDPSQHPLRDPRVSVHVEDGRFFLQVTERRFDLITGEPPPPKNAGIVNLYTREYFQLVHDRLTDGGITTYWLPVFSLALEDSRSIIRAFCDVFDDCSLWTGAAFNWMLAGTRGAAGIGDETRFAEQWRDPVVRRELRALGFERPEQLGATFIGDAAFLEEWTRGALPLVDDHPYRLSGEVLPPPAPEYFEAMDARAARERFAGSPWIRQIWPRALLGRTLAFFESHAVLTAWLQRSLNRGEIPRWLHWSLTRTSGECLPLLLLGSDADAQRLAAAAAARGADDERLRYELAIGALARRDYAEAAERLAALPAGQGDGSWLRVLRVLALKLAGQSEEARLVAETVRPGPADSEWAEIRSFLDELLGAGGAAPGAPESPAPPGP